ncbi:flagellar hook-length control protein FliK [Halomonas sp. 'Soap Lake |uniref:flagellar hook-length control protein FliK n=1 Tax=Halomonas sp. 'Soap Lake \|nr:flagellar hook-length control protein FliK [Halomonas sp. 'Soap Lake \
MSGITPLIDTLLHQVLGRQGEASLQRSLNAPVQPVPPGEGPRALQGDASLDGRPMSSPLGELKHLPASNTPDRQHPPSQGGSSTAIGSTQTHFSPAARTIADVLLRFPAPPSVMRPEAPLMNAQDAPTATALATRLEASVRDSGLFYESHLKRWFQGEVSRQQLLREPQMQPGPRPVWPASANIAVTAATPLAPGPSVPTAAGSLSILPNTTLVPVVSERPVLGRPDVLTANTPNLNATLQAERPETGQARADSGSLREVAEIAVPRRGREVVHENLQSLVRQQLEMLVMPTIRWEGDVWAGIFMALVINLPTRDDGQETAQDDADPEEAWRSEMQLEVPNVGAFRVSLWLYQATLSIDLTTDDLATHRQLEQGLDALERRLGALDFRKVQVNARYISFESHHDDVG